MRSAHLVRLDKQFTNLHGGRSLLVPLPRHRLPTQSQRVALASMPVSEMAGFRRLIVSVDVKTWMSLGKVS